MMSQCDHRLTGGRAAGSHSSIKCRQRFVLNSVYHLSLKHPITSFLPHSYLPTSILFNFTGSALCRNYGLVPVAALLGSTWHSE